MKTLGCIPDGHTVVAPPGSYIWHQIDARNRQSCGYFEIAFRAAELQHRCDLRRNP